MEEKLLHKCNDVAMAGYIIDVLKTNGITCRKHDEKMTQHPGAYGPDEGIALYVPEQDFEKAQEIIKPLITERSHSSSAIFCPKCDSEDIEVLPNPLQKHRTAILLASILLGLAPLVYFAWNFTIDKIATPTGNILAIVSFAISIVLTILSDKTKQKYRCKKCGKTFSRN